MTHLTIDWVLPRLVKPCITMQPRVLEKWKLGPINQQEPVTPFWTCMCFNELLCSLLFICIRKMNSLVMVWKKCNDNTISALLNSTHRDPCPLYSVLGRCCVTIVTSMEEKNAKLQVDGELRAVWVVGKYRVIDDKLNKTVKCLRLNPEFATKAFWAVDSPVVKEMELWSFWVEGGFYENTCTVDVFNQYFILLPPVSIVFSFEIGNWHVRPCWLGSGCDVIWCWGHGNVGGNKDVRRVDGDQRANWEMGGVRRISLRKVREEFGNSLLKMLSLEDAMVSCELL